jgi:large subunit ribosomal protein L34e
MPAPRQRSRSLRRTQVKMPGGDTKKVYSKRTPKVHKCAQCGVDLKGIPRLKTSEAKNVPKSKKTNERPFGGFLCSPCAREVLKVESRASE